MKTMCDLTGRRFGKLKVIEYVGRNKWGIPLWRCLCDCGNYRVATSSELLSGRSTACGCVHRQKSADNLRDIATKHGGSGSRLYRIWCGIKRRCDNENSQEYKYYGGRGITVCEEWARDFATFREWALSNGYAENLTIDRIDNDGNYCPENCRWVDMKTQNSNKRSNRYIEYNGYRITMMQWAECLNIKYGTLDGWLNSGHTFEEFIERHNIQVEEYEIEMF